MVLIDSIDNITVTSDGIAVATVESTDISKDFQLSCYDFLSLATESASFQIYIQFDIVKNQAIVFGLLSDLNSGLFKCIFYNDLPQSVNEKISNKIGGILCRCQNY